MKHSPQIRLINARVAYDRASEQCAHWDIDGTFDANNLHECCYALDEARAAYRKARKAAAEG